MKNLKLIATLLVVGLLLAGCGKGKPENLKFGQTGEGVQIEDRVSQLSKQFGVTLPEEAEKAALEAVDGSAANGIVTREENLITVLANLPDSKTGYEVILKSDDNQISLGKLNVAKGGWLLEKEISDAGSYKNVEIMEGQKTILKGSF